MTGSQKPAAIERLRALLAGLAAASGGVLALPIAGVALGHRFLRPGVTVADLCLAAFVPLAAWRLWRTAPRPRLPPFALWLAAFVSWALASGSLQILRAAHVFSLAEFAKSAAKLVFYAAAAVLLVMVARGAASGRAGRAVLVWFGLAAAYALVVYFAMLAQVPGVRDWICRGDIDCRAYYYELRWLGDHDAERALREQVYLRAVGLAPEPARLGLPQALALGHLLLGGAPVAGHPAALALIGGAATFSFSLAAYAVLLPVLGLAALRSRRLLGALAAVLLVLALAVTVVPAAREAFRHTVLVRAERILAGEADLSAQLRLVSSWQIAFALAADRPLAGVGLGQYQGNLPAVRERVTLNELFTPRTQGWNVLAHVLATTGAIGLVLFGVACWSALRASPALGLVFLVAMFADGAVLAPPFWLFFALYASEAASRAQSPNRAEGAELAAPRSAEAGPGCENGETRPAPPPRPGDSA